MKNLENAIAIRNNEIKDLLKQEKNHWKQLEQIIAKFVYFRNKNKNEAINFFSLNRRINLSKSNSHCEPQVDKNNENLPPIDTYSPVKVPKIHSKKKKKAST